MKVKKYIITIPLIGNDEFTVYIGDTFEHAAKKCEKDYDGLEFENYNYRGMVVYLNHEETKVVNWAMILSSDISYAVIVHECVHMAYEILDYRGIKHSVDNQEILAYLVEYIYIQIEKIYEGNSKKL